MEENESNRQNVKLRKDTESRGGERKTGIRCIINVGEAFGYTS